MTKNDLTIRRTLTGYWTVHRGDVELAGAMTRKGAEAERELLRRLEARRTRRPSGRPATGARPGAGPATGVRPTAGVRSS